MCHRKAFSCSKDCLFFGLVVIFLNMKTPFLDKQLCVDAQGSDQNGGQVTNARTSLEKSSFISVLLVLCREFCSII